MTATEHGRPGTITGSIASGGSLPAGMSIAPVTGPARLREIEDLQLRIWGGDPREVIPAHMLYVVEKSGGVLLAAYDRDRPAGFVLGLLGRRNGRPYHVSHILGIHPDYQGRGIGVALKQAQREAALAQGLTLMTWTYDPLEARNAHFNLHKLGATTRTYDPNLYGDMEDDLNRGMPSDRLTVEWQLDRQPERHEHVPPGTVILLANEADRPVPCSAPPLTGVPLAITIPRNVQRIKAADLSAALTWRLAVRQAFSWAFDRGYRAVDFTGGAYLLIQDIGEQSESGSPYSTETPAEGHGHED